MMYEAHANAYGEWYVTITGFHSKYDCGPFLSVQDANRFGRKYVEEYDN